MATKHDASYRDDEEDAFNEDGKIDDDDTSSKKRPAMRISNIEYGNHDINSDAMIKDRKKMRRKQEIVWQTTERHAFMGPTVDIHTLSGRFGGKESLRKYLPLPEFDCLLGWATHATRHRYHGDSNEPVQTNSNGTTTGSPTSHNNIDDDEVGNNDKRNSRNEEEEDGNKNDENCDNHARVASEAKKASVARDIIPNPLIGIQPDSPLPRSYLDCLIHERARALLRGQRPGSAHYLVKRSRQESMQQWESLVGQCNTSALVAMGVILEEAMTANLLPLAEYHVRRCRQMEDQEEASAKAAAPKKNTDNSDLGCARSIDEGSFGQWTLPPEEAIFNVIAHSLAESTCRNHTDSHNNNDTNNQHENTNNGTQEDHNQVDQESTLASSGRATENAKATSSWQRTEGPRAAENGMEDGLAAENDTMELTSTEADDSGAATKSTGHDTGVNARETGCDLLPTGPQAGEIQPELENNDKAKESSDTRELLRDTRRSPIDKNGLVNTEPTSESADIDADNAMVGVASTEGTAGNGQESTKVEPTVLELSEEKDTNVNPHNEESSSSGKSTDDDDDDDDDNDDESDIREQPRKFTTKGLGLLPSACQPTLSILSPPESETDTDDDDDDDDDDKDDNENIDSSVKKTRNQAEAAAARFCHRQKLEPRAVQRNMDIYQWFLPIAPPLVDVAKAKKAKRDHGRRDNSARSTSAKKKKAVAAKKKPAGSGKRKTIVAKKKPAGSGKKKTTVAVSGTKKKPAGTSKNRTTVPVSRASKETTSGTPEGLRRSTRNKK